MEEAARTPFVEEIDFNEITILEVIGKGSFGVVNKGKWRDTFVAVKRIDTESEKKAFLVERQQLSRVSHPNIVKLYGTCTKSPVCLVMEYAEGGSLYNVLHGTPQPSYTAAHAISWVHQCALGVAYLHDMKPKALIHRDLKPPNLLLILGGTVLKICDFGTACDIQTHMTNNKGSAAWMAPEVFEGCKYSEKCDVFSWGIILWEVITRRKPFDEVGAPAYRIMWAVHNGQRPPLIKGCPSVLENLMTSCWDREPQKRPSMGEVVKSMDELSHYFQGADQPIQYSSQETTPCTSEEVYDTEGEEEEEEEEEELNTMSNSSGTQKSSDQLMASPSHERLAVTPTLKEDIIVVVPPTPMPTRTIVIEDPLPPLVVDVNSTLPANGSPLLHTSQVSAPPSLANSRENLLLLPNWKDTSQKRLSGDLSQLKISDLKINVGQPASPTHRRTGSYGSLVTTSSVDVSANNAASQQPKFLLPRPSTPTQYRMEGPSPPAPTTTTYRTNCQPFGNWQHQPTHHHHLRHHFPTQHQQQQPPQQHNQQFNSCSSQENVGDYLHLMLEPQYQPIPPYPNSQESRQIYDEHKQMAHECIQVQTDLAILTQRKKHLAEELGRLNDTTWYQTYPNNMNKCFEELLQLQSEKKSLEELHHNLKRQLEILTQGTQRKSTTTSTTKTKTSTADGWELLSAD